MSNVKQIKQQIVNCKSPIQLMSMFRAGFELEFHALEGHCRDDLGLDFDAEPDYDLLGDRSSEALSEASDSDLVEHLPHDYRKVGATLEKHFSWIGIRDIFDAFGEEGRCDDAEESWRSDWESNELENNSEDYYPNREYDFDTGGLPLELCDDSSVQGGEIRTVGGLSTGEFFACAKQAFSHSLEIDPKCSFHIHLSVPGIKHSYGKGIQASMMEYLLNNYGRWPDSVKERIVHMNYYKVRLSTDKYTFVHMHEQGTWEFRIFGNVKNVSDAMTCLLLACEAMQYAYAKQLERDELVLTLSDTAIVDGMNKVCVLYVENISSIEIGSVRRFINVNINRDKQPNHKAA